MGYHGLAGRDFALPHMHVVEFGDLLGLLKGLEQELGRFDAAPEEVLPSARGVRSHSSGLQPGCRTRLLPENMGPHLLLHPMNACATLRWPRPGTHTTYCRQGLQAWNFVASLPRCAYRDADTRRLRSISGAAKPRLISNVPSAKRPPLDWRISRSPRWHGG